MVVAFILGLVGSLGHCVGMCSGVVMLLSRRGGLDGARLPLVHLGRVTTYAVLGLVLGAVGRVLGIAPHGLRQLQGTVAIVAGAVAIYMALALLGRVPSPELLVSGLTKAWGRAMQRLIRTGDSRPVVPLYVIGLVWGLLPCGLVLTALVTAAVAGSPWQSALTMLAFGLGTWPALYGMDWVTRRGFRQIGPWARPIAALVVFVFGTQMALRGLAAWGWVEHLRLGGLVVW